MERSKSKSGQLGRSFICLFCVALIASILLESVLPAQARRARRPIQKSNQKSKNTKKPEKAPETTPSTTKEFFQDVSNLGRAYAVYDRGLNEYMIGDYGLAAEHLGQAADIFSATYGQSLPQQETVYYDLALAQESAGNLDGAIASFKKSLSNQAGFFDGHLALAQLYGRMGNWQLGADSVKRALDLRPDDPRANLIYGLILEKQGQMLDAEKFKTKARNFVSTYGLAGVKTSADKEAKVEELPANVSPDNLPGEGPKDLELP